MGKGNFANYLKQSVHSFQKDYFVPAGANFGNCCKSGDVGIFGFSRGSLWMMEGD